MVFSSAFTRSRRSAFRLFRTSAEVRSSVRFSTRDFPSAAHCLSLNGLRATWAISTVRCNAHSVTRIRAIFQWRVKGSRIRGHCALAISKIVSRNENPIASRSGRFHVSNKQISHTCIPQKFLTQLINRFPRNRCNLMQTKHLFYLNICVKSKSD